MKLENDPIESRLEKINLEEQINDMLHKNKFTIPELKDLIYNIPALFIFIIIEWLTRDKEHALAPDKLPLYTRWSLYIVLGFVVFLAIDNNPNAFIYLQF